MANGCKIWLQDILPCELIKNKRYTLEEYFNQINIEDAARFFDNLNIDENYFIGNFFRLNTETISDLYKHLEIFDNNRFDLDVPDLKNRFINLLHQRSFLIQFEEENCICWTSGHLYDPIFQWYKSIVIYIFIIYLNQIIIKDGYILKWEWVGHGRP